MDGLILVERFGGLALLPKEYADIRDELLGRLQGWEMSALPEL